MGVDGGSGLVAICFGASVTGMEAVVEVLAEVDDIEVVAVVD